jgi:CheY-like chemotaxis protein
MLLSKPYRQDDLTRKIRTVLGKRSSVAPRQGGDVTAAAPTVAAAPSTASTAPQPTRATVMIVEDDALIRLSTGEYLRDCGYEVLEAGRGDAALRLLEQHSEVAVLLTDFGLPGMNGGELVRQAQAQRPALPAILITGRSREAVEATRLLSDKVHVLEKPYELGALRRMVEELLGGRTPTA